MFNRSTHTVERTDPDIWSAIENEHRRQEQHIELIASENYASPAVLAAQGSQLTNKYAEGYPASAITEDANTSTLRKRWRLSG